VLVHKTLAAWGAPGLDAHVRRLQAAYAARAALCCAAAAEHLRGLAAWRAPLAGMFLWVRLLGVEDAGEVWEDLVREGVEVLPGRIMHCR
jgi:kynurenine/2-aminoadipate aminotransferase